MSKLVCMGCAGSIDLISGGGGGVGLAGRKALYPYPYPRKPNDFNVLAPNIMLVWL